MEKAIPTFLHIPILHTDHSERPAGFVTECHVVKAGDPILCTDHPDYDPHAKPGDTYFKAKIPEDGDTDDIWGEDPERALQQDIYLWCPDNGIR